MSGSPLPLPGTATHEAAQWHALHRQGPLTAGEQACFLQWLTTSPEHLREYLAVGRVAAALGGALQAMDIDVDALLASEPAERGNVVALPLPPPSRPGTRRNQGVRTHAPRWHRAAIAACMALLVATSAWFCWPRTYSYSTAHAEQRSITLPDGSSVHLNAQTTLRARFSLLRREVTLLQGQATFQVGQDRRPFALRAAGLRVRDIGTTFDVALHREQVRVGVTEGRVWVSAEGAAGPPLADLRAGQSARIDNAGRHAQVSDENIAAMTAWWQRRVVFRDDRLGDVADQFNRLNRVRLQVDDPAAAALRLTGNLHGDDVESLRLFLAQQPHLQAVREGDVIRVRSRQ